MYLIMQGVEDRSAEPFLAVGVLQLTAAGRTLLHTHLVMYGSDQSLCCWKNWRRQVANHTLPS